MRSPNEKAEQLNAGIAALVNATVNPPSPGVDRSALLAAVAQPASQIVKRPAVPLRAAVFVFRRDSWTCRYCGIKTIAAPVLRYLSSVYPKEFPYHEHWKAGSVHEAWLLLSTSLDHLVPGARGGDWTAPENLITACWACNSAKADLLLPELGWDMLTEDAVRSDWDGLASAVNALWELAGSPDALFKNWRRALRAS